MELGNYNWSLAFRDGAEIAAAEVKSNVTVRETHVMWALLKEAAQTSKRAYSGPPRTGFPRKSVMPDAPDDVSQWQMMMAYLQGVIEDAPAEEPRPPTPSAEQITRSEAVLHVWHHFALRNKGARNRMKKAVYLKACGVPDRKVRAVTGFTRQAIHSAKEEAMRDMWEAIRAY